MLFWPIFGDFWCPVETVVTFSSNLSSFERNQKKLKNPKKIQNLKKIQKKSKKSRKSKKTSKKHQKNPKKIQ